MNTLEILISRLSGETLVASYLLIETPDLIQAIENNASYDQLKQIISENF